jgi:hypothetical protein
MGGSILNKLKLSDWASIAEVLGAIAVVVSLLFVGFQIGEGNREARATRVQAALDSEMVFQAAILREASVWEKIVTGAPLAAGQETRKGIILYNMLQTQNENRYLQMQSGYLEHRTSDLLRTASLPFYEIWRESPGAKSRSPEWLEILDKAHERASTD